LSANECVASWLEAQGVPSIYRIHEKPEPRRVVEFEDIAASFGYSLGLGALPVKRVQMKSDRRQQHGRGKNPRMHEIPEDIPVTPRMYQKLTAKIAGTPEERIVSYLMLRSLKQARYSEKNEGHFALAAPSYTHFTSPIRRYPDLMVHRVVKAVLAAGVEGHGDMDTQRAWSPWHHQSEGTQQPRPRRDFIFAHNPPVPESELAAIAQECSQTERRADDAERELVEWKKIKFMQDRVGEDFNAMILNATKFGVFVELDDLFIEGLVPIDTLRGDRFTFNENTRQILGDRSGRKYSPGDKVRVLLDRVNAVERRLQFAMLDENGGEGAARPTPNKGGKAKAKPKRKSRNEKRRSPSAPGSVNRKGRGDTKRPKRRKT